MASKILFNSYNTTSAGTSNITKFILVSLFKNEAAAEDKKLYFILPDIKIFKEFKSSAEAKIIKLPVFFGLFNYIFRCFYEVLFLPVISIILGTPTVIIMANYSPVILHGKKIVFMRHPYLVENQKTDPFLKGVGFIEFMRRLIFKITLLSSDLIIVQSSYMKKRLTECFGRISKIAILPNPVSNLMKMEINIDKKKNKKSLIVLYVSRFYPHKNHWFLLGLVDRYRDEFRRKKIKFYITVNSSFKDKDSRIFLNEIDKRGLTGIILNIGEIPNEMLGKYYREARCFFFPSCLETYGNPLVEAMAFGLPVVAPDLSYVHAICNDSCLYYSADDVEDAYKKLTSVLYDDDFYKQISIKGLNRVKKFPSVESWLHQLVSLTRSC